MFCLFILRLRVYFVLKNLVIEMLKKKERLILFNKYIKYVLVNWRLILDYFGVICVRNY